MRFPSWERKAFARERETKGKEVRVGKQLPHHFDGRLRRSMDLLSMSLHSKARSVMFATGRRLARPESAIS